MKVELDNLLAEVGAKLPQNLSVAEKCRKALSPSMVWVGELLVADRDQDYAVLLRGSYGSALEAVSLVAFGMIRPAVLSLRSHYELSLQSLYYRDHPVEWNSVLAYRSQPLLPGNIKKYLKENFPNFEQRMSVLKSNTNRSYQDCYNVLSGVAHGTAVNSISSAMVPMDLIESKLVVEQSIPVFESVGECVSDIFLSCYQSNWLSVPNSVRQSIALRLDGSNCAKSLFFS